MVHAIGRLQGKVAVVTGGARGSGEAIARRFVAEGGHVVIADIRDDLALAVVESLGESAAYIRADVTSESDWQVLVSATVERFGKLNVLVNNAAVLHMAPIASTTVADYERVFRVNELGTFLGIKTAAGPMTDAGGGSIVNISSIDGMYVAPFTGAYAASKFAVRGLAKAAALELGSAGIRVNCICPAAGNPEMVIEALPESLRAAMTRDDGKGLRAGHRTPPVGRHGRMEDVAWAAVFLASDESGYMTGTELLLDGGETAGMNLMQTMTRS